MIVVGGQGNNIHLNDATHISVLYIFDYKSQILNKPIIVKLSSRNYLRNKLFIKKNFKFKCYHNFKFTFFLIYNLGT